MRANLRPGAMNYLQVIRASQKQCRGVAEAVSPNCNLDEQQSASMSRQCRHSSLFVEGNRACGRFNVILADRRVAISR